MTRSLPQPPEPATPDSGGLVERVFAIAVLLVFTDGIIRLLVTEGRPSGVDLGEGSRAYQLAAAFTYFGTLLLVLSRPTRMMRLARTHWLLLLPVLLAITSATWSQEPTLSIRRGIALLATTAFAFYLTSRYSFRQFLRLLGFTFALVVLSSFVFGIGLRKYGVHSDIHAGDWRGIFVHKNRLGLMMVLGLTVFASLAIGERGLARTASLASAVGAGILLILSNSVLSAIVGAFVLFTLPVLLLQRQRRTGGWILGAWLGCAAAGVALALANAGAILPHIGRDPTFSGRTFLWAVSLDRWLDRPILGYGYRAFWIAGASASANAWKLLGWEPTSAHNSFLDILLELGIVGLIPFLMMLLRYAPFLFRSLRRGPFGVWYILATIALTSLSLGESVLLAQNSISWVMLVATFIYARQQSSDTLPPAAGA
ncbi:MAG TPA: O-antigen ligase [Terriglobales bacterium]